MKGNKIKIEIKVGSDECEKLREEGLFFQMIAEVLNIKREDIKEIDARQKLRRFQMK